MAAQAIDRLELADVIVDSRLGNRFFND